ncbi:MAG TPA: Cof-type HAD-IIB family hydrolase [Bacilli bacterium]|nr:Cof-type HAD-IIB family hydrolase [Bacilli bacterium]
MDYKMLVCDIDGTLLDSNSQLAPQVIEAIREAHKQGVVITLASGRPLRGVVPIARQLGVNVPVILGNGALIVDPLKQETLLHRGLDEATTHAILDVIAAHRQWAGVFTHAFEGIDTYYDRHPGHREALLFVNKDPQVSQQVESLKQIAHLDPIKVLSIEKTESVKGLVQDLRSLAEERKFNFLSFDHDFPGFTFLECFEREATKARAIHHLARELGIAREQIVTVGDNLNDLEMVEYAGLGVAMGNAVPELRAKADWQTTTNDEYGVAHLIRERILTR